MSSQMGQPAADSAASLPQPLREPGEQVIWADQPDAWHLARGYVLPGWGGVGLLYAPRQRGGSAYLAAGVDGRTWTHRAVAAPGRSQMSE